jgi:hypothetical protein
MKNGLSYIYALFVGCWAIMGGVLGDRLLSVGGILGFAMALSFMSLGMLVIFAFEYLRLKIGSNFGRSVSEKNEE